MAALTRAQRRAAAAMLEDQRDEKIAPAAQRKPVANFRGPLVERAGHGFVRSNPIRGLWSRSKGRARAERGPQIVTDLHLACSERLLRAYNETCDGIAISAGFSGERSGGTPTTGSINARVLNSVNHQITQAREWHGARTFLGAHLWRPVHSVVLLGMDVKSWAAALDWDERVAMGYLLCALDRLAEYYAAITPKSRPTLRAGVVVGTNDASVSA